MDLNSQISSQRMKQKLTKKWWGKYMSGEAATLTARPTLLSVVGHGRSHMHFNEPILNCNSSHQSEVDRMIHEVRKQDKDAAVYVFILDQSLQKNVLQICLERPKMMSNILVVFDWFHVGSWSMCALFQLTHKTFLHWFVTKLQVGDVCV